MTRRDVTRYLEEVGFAPIAELARVAGQDPRTVRSWVIDQSWPMPFPWFVGLPGTTMDAGAWARAAVRYVGGEVAVTRRTALHLLGLSTAAPTRVQLLVPASRRRSRHPRLDVTRTRDWDAEQVTSHHGLPIVRPERLVRDLADGCSVSELRRIVIDLVQRRHLTLAALADRHHRAATYPGRGRVGEVLDQLQAVGRTDSPLEFEVRRRLADAGLELDRGQVPVRCRDGVTIHLDLGVARWRFGVEVDSMAAHATREQLRTDAQRSNQLAALPQDWRVVRVTWEDLEPGRWSAVRALILDVAGAQAGRADAAVAPS